jgi:hypothetical protein
VGIIGGLAIGATLGALIGKLVLYLRTRHQEAVGLDEFLALGSIAIAYGVAQLCFASGFLAVFAAGLALQRIKEHSKAGQPQRAARVTVVLGAAREKELATHSRHAGTYMMQAVQGFNGQLERLAEVVVVMVVGRFVLYLFAGPRPLVPVAAVFRGAPRFRLVGIDGRDHRIARSARLDLLVRHSRCRLDFLRDVRDQSWLAGRIGQGADRDHAHHGRRIGPAPRHFGDATDERVYEAEDSLAPLSSATDAANPPLPAIGYPDARLDAMKLSITGSRSELGTVLARQRAPSAAGNIHVNVAGQQANTLLHDGHAWKDFGRIALAGTRRAIRSAQTDGASMLVHASFAFVHAVDRGARVDEPLRSSVDAILECEELNPVESHPCMHRAPRLSYGPQSADLRAYRNAFVLGRP